MLFTCGQVLFGFRGCLLAMSKQPLSEPPGELRSFHLGSGNRFMVPCLRAKWGRDFFRNVIGLVEDVRGERERERRGEESEPEMFGCEVRGLRFRDKKGPALWRPFPLQGHQQRSRQELLTACHHGTRGTQGSGTVASTVSQAGLSSGSPLAEP